ncbi:MAG: hypothetical protein ABSE90_11115, partial [Verrucomicrobiota bacterium]
MSETKIKTPEQIAEAFRVAVHEAGHHEAAMLLGVMSCPKVLSESERQPASNGKVNVGVCELDSLAKMTPFQEAVIGFAGYVAEHVCGVALPSYRNPFPFEGETLPNAFSFAFKGLEENFSHEDVLMICSGGKTNAEMQRNARRAFKSACAKLLPRAEKLKRMAELIIKNGDEAQRFYQDGPAIAALRDFFRRRNEMAHDDFVQLVAGGDAPRFERFLDSRVALNLTSNRTTDIEDAKRVMGT